MEGKKDIDTMFEELKRICLEHRALKVLLHECIPHSWQHDALTFAAKPIPANRVQAQFHEAIASIQYGMPLPSRMERLLNALSQTNLDDEWTK